MFFSEIASGDASLRSIINATKKDLLNELRSIHSSSNALQSKICNVQGTLEKILETQDAEIKPSS